MTRKSLAFFALALAGGAVCAQSVAQSVDIIVTSGGHAPPPVIWGAMDAFDLQERAWRQSRPALTIDSNLIEQKARERQASIDRLRTRYAERLRATQNAGAPVEGSASVGAGEPAPAQQPPR